MKTISVTAQRTKSSFTELLERDGPVARLCNLAGATLRADRIELDLGGARYAYDGPGTWTKVESADRPPTTAMSSHSVEVRRPAGRVFGTLSIASDRMRRFGPVARAHLEQTASLIADLVQHHRAVDIAARSLQRQRRSRDLLREQARELWRRQAVFEQTERLAKVGGWATDLRTNEMTWTDEIYRISELPVGKSVPVDRALSFYTPEAREQLSNAIIRTMREHTPFDLELEYVTALGNARWVRAMGQIEVLDGAPARVFGTFQDVTDKKLGESRMWQAAESRCADRPAEPETLHGAKDGLPCRRRARRRQRRPAAHRPR